jgi:hypothetical protein
MTGEFALPLAQPSQQFAAGPAGSERGGRSVMTTFSCRLSGLPPNLATRSLLPSRSTRASKQRRGPPEQVSQALTGRYPPTPDVRRLAR